MTRATIEVYLFLAKMVFERLGSLTQNLRGKKNNGPFLFMILLVDLGHGGFRPVAVIFFSKSVSALERS